MNRKKIGAALSAVTATLGGSDSSVAAIKSGDMSSVQSLSATLKTAMVSAGVELAAETDFGSMVPFMVGEAKTSRVISSGSLLSPSMTPGAESVSTEDGLRAFGIMSANDVAALSVESFDGRMTNNQQAFRFVLAAYSNTGDAFGEAFFPTVAIDPTISGLELAITNPYLMTEVTHDVSGRPSAKQFNYVPLQKAYANSSFFEADGNKCIPVDRPEAASALVHALSSTTVYNGETYTTAPIAIGKSVNLLGLSQTDSMLAKGELNNTDTLEASIVVSYVYLELTAGTDNEFIQLPVAELLGSGFTQSVIDQGKDLNLRFITTDVELIAGTTQAFGGVSSVILDALPAGTSIKLSMYLSGTGNTQIGDIGVYVNALTIDSVLDAGGAILDPSSTTYATVAAALAGMTIVGYDLDAYRTNANLRTIGQVITQNVYTQIEQVPFRQPLTFQGPVVTAGSVDADVTALANLIPANELRRMHGAVDTLLGFAKQLRAVASNPVTAVNKKIGFGSYVVNPFYINDTINLSKATDSLNSSERMQDIKAAFLNKITVYVQRAWMESNYMQSHAIQYGNNGKKPLVIVGTDPVIQQFLLYREASNRVKLGNGFELEVVSSPIDTMRNRMFITFRAEEEDKGVNPLSFGVCGWSPSITVDVTKTLGGAQVRQITVLPRFKHIPILPVLADISVINIADVLGGKVAINIQEKSVTTF